MMGTHSAYGLQGVLPSLALNVGRLSRSGAAALPSVYGRDVRDLATGYPVEKWLEPQDPPVQHVQPHTLPADWAPVSVTVGRAVSYSPEAENLLADAVARWRALGFHVIVGRRGEDNSLRFVPGWTR